MTPRLLSGLILGALAAAACAEGAVDAASFGTEPADPRPSAPAAAPADAPAPEVPEAPGGDAGVDATIDGSADASAEASFDSGVEAGVDAGTPPALDGIVAAGEYGAHVDGQNMQASPGAAPTTTWYVTWTETHLFVAVSAANVTEGLVLYVDHDPGGLGGSLAGTTYDGTRIASLPIRADFVAYVKSSYQEIRTATGGGWSGASTTGITVAGSGDVREIAIPWTVIRAGGRPASFAWLGYVTSPGGYVYGPMPTSNPGGFVGTNATYAAYYSIGDATPGSGSKPFSLALP